METIDIDLVTTEDGAWELAQLCKRISLSEIRVLSADEEEARVMLGAVLDLQRSLASAGYSPR